MSDALRCRSSDRRARVRKAPRLTGIDYVDYARAPAPTLTVHLLGPLPQGITARSFVVEGGRRVTGIRVVSLARVRGDEADPAVALQLDAEGDPSTYTVRLVRDADRDRSLPDGVDPRYDRASFSFKLDCPADIDCEGARAPRADAGGGGPVLDYLAKDYASFRRLLFDRLSLTLPAWRETHAPDVGVALVELMAYAADHLSYQQDAVATEAYLETARKRISVRRHARLVDYRMHEGANARAWVTVCVDQDVTWKAEDVAFYTKVTGLSSAVTEEKIAASGERHEVFLPVTDRAEITLRAALGRISFYTWGGEECCLPRGATRATLALPRSEQPLLAPGDVLILEEVVGPATGLPEHADPAHRHPVRLARVTEVRDPLVERGARPGEGPQQEVALYDVEWMAEDALPFPLRLSSLDAARGCAPIRDVSVARGNVLLVDHGRFREEDLGCVEGDEAPPVCDGPGRTALTSPRARPYRPTLRERPVTFRAPLLAWEALDAQGNVVRVPPPASAALRHDPREALPVVSLRSTPCGDERRCARCTACGAEQPRGSVARRRPRDAQPPPACVACSAALETIDWTARFDLLDSSGDDAHIAVEIDDEGYAHVRFGDGVNGRAPEPGMGFVARYRVGCGPSGNVAAEAIAHVSLRGGLSGVSVRVRNPLPAAGGAAPEPVDDVRLLAPEGLRARRERAVTADDYAEIAARDHAALHRAAGALRWTGSWYEALVAIDPLGSEETPPALRGAVERRLERYRRIGHDLRVAGARYVPLDVALTVCVEPGYLRAHVRKAVAGALVGTATSRGFFDPDRLTFGQAVSLSALVAAVHAVPGVLDVQVTRLARMFEGDRGELDAGELAVGPLEIVRLDNDPARPEDGVLDITMRGGR
ncbi:hypothetical protein BE20_58810 [Sorangium cellulosum]|nr:hypothetical protein BE20_58810 [Sorangium cellulosum]